MLIILAIFCFVWVEYEAAGSGINGYSGPTGYWGTDGTWHFYAQDYDYGQRVYLAANGRAGAGAGGVGAGAEGAAMGYANYDQRTNTLQASLQINGRLRFGPIIIVNQGVYYIYKNLCFNLPSNQPVCYYFQGSIQSNFGGSGYLDQSGQNWGNTPGGGWSPTVKPGWYNPSTACPNCTYDPNVIATEEPAAASALDVLMSAGMALFGVSMVALIA